MHTNLFEASSQIASAEFVPFKSVSRRTALILMNVHSLVSSAVTSGKWRVTRKAREEQNAEDNLMQ
jgi:hypothetical protein